MVRLIAVGAVLLQIASVATATPPPRDAVEKSADAADKMICKRFLETGSLVKAQRVCKTKADWERSRTEARQLDTTRSCSGIGGDSLCK